MNVVTTIFYLGLGLFLLFGSLFQYHEVLVGLCALVIGIVQLVGLFRGNA
jgi:hypothetical protein